MTDLSAYLSLASLVVAALAVVLGPLVSWKISKQQSEVTLHVAHKQISASMRQAWIDSLRERVAEAISTAHWFYVAGESDTPHPKIPWNDFTYSTQGDYDRARSAVERKLIFLTRQIELMLDSQEEEHRLLNQCMAEVVESAVADNSAVRNRLVARCDAAMKQCQKVLRFEWGSVAQEFEKRAGGKE